MKCFYHPQAEAIGTCKNCHKGVCQQCAVDVGNGIACKNMCEDRVKAVNDLVDKNMAAYKKTYQVYLRTAIGSVIAGLILIAFGLSEFHINPTAMFFLLLLGLISFYYAGITYSSGRKFLKK